MASGGCAGCSPKTERVRVVCAIGSVLPIDQSKVVLCGKCHATSRDAILWSVTQDDKDAVWLQRDRIEWIEATPLTDEVVVIDRDLAVQKGLING
jgi:hypothetical protein